MKRKRQFLIIIFLLVIFGIIFFTFRRSKYCSDEYYYKEHASLYEYELHDDYVAVRDGNIITPEGMGTSIIKAGEEFHILGGIEEAVSVKLEKMEGKKAYFKLRYSAGPPACESLLGCGYVCEFTIEK